MFFFPRTLSCGFRGKENQLLGDISSKRAATLGTFSLAGEHNTSHSLLLTRMKTDYRYPGIKDAPLPGDTLLLVLTLVNITVARSTYGAATLLMCAFGQWAEYLVKSRTRNFNW